MVLILLVTLAGIVLLASRKMETYAQGQVPKHVRVPTINDWSRRHMVYSKPASAAQSMKLKSEPRYQQQIQKRNMKIQQSAH